MIILPRILIQGNRPLTGAITIGGHKNAAVAILPAALLATSLSTVQNVPGIGDARTTAHLLEQMGVGRSRPSGNSQSVLPG